MSTSRIGDQRHFLSLFLLGLFLFTTLIIPLCHTEHGFQEDPYCPACHFKTSCLGTQFIPLAEISEPELAGFAYRSEPSCFERIFPVQRPTRSPPIAGDFQYL